jgi:hypothetical protein
LPGFEGTLAAQLEAIDPYVGRFVPLEVGMQEGVTAQQTVQNRRWRSQSVFRRIQQLPEYRQHFGRPVVQGQHYAQSGDDAATPETATVWLTTRLPADPDTALPGLTQIAAYFLPAAIGPLYYGQDLVSWLTDASWRDRLIQAPLSQPPAYLDRHKRGWLEGSEKFPGLLVLYKMADDVPQIPAEHGGADLVDVVRGGGRGGSRAEVFGGGDGQDPCADRA